MAWWQWQAAECRLPDRQRHMCRLAERQRQAPRCRLPEQQQRRLCRRLAERQWQVPRCRLPGRQQQRRLFRLPERQQQPPPPRNLITCNLCASSKQRHALCESSTACSVSRWARLGRCVLYWQRLKSNHGMRLLLGCFMACCQGGFKTLRMVCCVPVFSLQMTAQHKRQREQEHEYAAEMLHVTKRLADVEEQRLDTDRQFIAVMRQLVQRMQ